MIRSAIKSSLKKVLGMEERPAPPPPAPAWRATAPPYPRQDPPAPVDAPAVAPAEPAEPVAVAPEVAPEAPPEVAVQEAAPAPVEPPSDAVGPMLSLEALQEVMDEMVRPALQGDGGDITLVKIENNDVYVRLVGSCKTCPSSIMTMRLGVEALLKEEFPSMGELINVE